MAVKNATALLDRFCREGIAIEVTHRSKRRLYGLAALALLRDGAAAARAGAGQGTSAKWVGRSSQTPGLQRNADDSADIFFGPTPPSGHESNWVPTDANGRFEVLARFYGPEKPLFDKTWKLPDIERAAAQ